jgi:uncharacterized protein
MKRWIPEWWAKKTTRALTYGWLVITLLADGCYLLGIEWGSFELYQFGKYLWASSIVLSGPMAVALTLCFIVLRKKERPQNTQGKDPEGLERRELFLKMALLPPVLAGAASFGGLVRANMSPTLHEVEVVFPHLPPALEGLRILQVTDAHLGPFIGLDSIDDAVEALDGTRVDIVAITGDFADHLRLAKPAIERLASLKPTHGVFFSMGNHEYYHPEGKVRATLDSLGVQTLVNSGTALNIDDATLYLGGADDPARTQEEEVPFLLASTEKALNGMPSDAFSLLLSHRPRGFDAAQKFNVDLTLSGHTHGYQVGLFGQSVAESFAAGTYPRGLYQSGASQLYTSTGLGHWFPFRLGCDREAAVIVLRRAKLNA